MALFTFSQRSSAVYPCEDSLVYEILTDYDSHAEWLPQIAASKLLAREGDLAIAEYELLHPREEKFTVECIHTRNRMVLWRAIRGNIPIVQVQWDIAAADGGRAQVNLSIERRLSWSLLVPGLRRCLSAKQCLRALQEQLAVFSPELELPGEEGEKILEIYETPQGMECCIRDQRYRLTPAGEGFHD